MEAPESVQQKELNQKRKNKMENLNEKKDYVEILLALKVEDIKDAIRFGFDSDLLNNLLTEYQVRKKECQNIGVDTRKYDKRVKNFIGRLNDVPISFII